MIFTISVKASDPMPLPEPSSHLTVPFDSRMAETQILFDGGPAPW